MSEQFVRNEAAEGMRIVKECAQKRKHCDDQVMFCLFFLFKLVLSFLFQFVLSSSSVYPLCSLCSSAAVIPLFAIVSLFFLIHV